MIAVHAVLETMEYATVLRDAADLYETQMRNGSEIFEIVTAEIENMIDSGLPNVRYWCCTRV